MESGETTIRLPEALSEADAKRLDRASLVERLVAHGVSRLSADRIASVLKGEADAGRARRHTQAHR